MVTEARSPLPGSIPRRGAAAQRACLLLLGLLGGLAAASAAHAAAPSPDPVAMQPIGARFEIDRTEVSIGAFRRHAEATGLVTQAERAGGGSTYEGGWQQRRGWTWRAPFGRPGDDDEPAVHLTQPEAAAYCRWAGKRLPTDAEWLEAAHVERRPAPPAGFATGTRYPFPTGSTPAGANCLDCAPAGRLAPAQTSRGRGHARVGSTAAGVNGLFDMGANVWEWVDSGPGDEAVTRGGSWWYGPAQMHHDHRQTKPRDTAVVYIGFRCARSLP